jgi:condensin complex subunit 1
LGRLEDKSSPVRTNAIRLLTRFMETHPFSADGGLLSMEFFSNKVQHLESELEVMI